MALEGGFSIGKVVPSLLALALLGTGLAAPFDLLSPAAQRSLGVTVCAVILWTARPIPIELTSLLLLLLIPLTGLLSFKETFQPFANPAVWLVFAGLVISLALSSSGLDRALAARARCVLGGSRFRLLVSLHALGLAAAILIPSGVVRVMLLVPFGVALIEGDRGKNNPLLEATILLSLVCSTYYGGCGILTGAVPNLVVAGRLEEATGRVLFWGEWLQWMFPVIGVMRTSLCVGVVWLLFARRLAPSDWRPELRNPAPPLDRSQRRMLGILLSGVALWATDTLHHLPPVYIGLVLVVACVLPRWGPLRVGQIREANLPFLFYLVALFGIGTILQQSGFTGLALDYMLSRADIESLPVPEQHLAITAVVLPLDFLMDIAAVAAVVTPTMLEFGGLLGLSPVAAAMSVAMATTLVFLPYQSAPFMVALGFGRFTMGQLVACMMTISIFSALVLCPLNVLYWHAFGLI